MSLQEKHYIIKPKQILLDKLKEYQQLIGMEVYSYMDDHFIWASKLGRQIPMVSINDIKVLFLCNIHSDLIVKNDYPDLTDFVRQLLGESKFTPAIFDQWWEIVSVPFGVEYTDETIQFIEQESLDRMDPLDDRRKERLDVWIDFWRRLRKA